MSIALAEETASLSSIKMLKGERAGRVAQRILCAHARLREERDTMHFKIHISQIRDLTFSLRSGSPLQRELTDTLNDFQAGLKLFITTWEEKDTNSDLKRKGLTFSYFNRKTTREATAGFLKRTSIWDRGLDEDLRAWVF